MVSPDSDYRKVLKDELETRIRHNPSYSLRAFARDLSLAPSRLSEILKGKQGLSRGVADRIAGKLGLGAEDSAVFCDLVESLHGRYPQGRVAARSRLEALRLKQDFRTLELDSFKAISDWYHFAILQLMKLPGFKSDVKWIAGALEISVAEASDALKRLERLKLIEVRSRGYFPVQDYVASPEGVSSEAIRNFHRQVLAKAVLALSDQTVEERDFSAILMPISSSSLGDVQQRIKRFRRELCRSVSSTGEPDSVYCLSTQFFRVSRKGRVK